ncbi:MAG: hypothetical protein C4583_10605 [Anaerolineaceae bacterium]|nr:MAG: hypothetical protein C4583_10605 [Anaerolineaceae bacterium]
MPSNCQLYSLKNIHQPLRRQDKLWQFRNRLKRIAKRRINYLSNVIGRMRKMNTLSASVPEKRMGFQPGDRVCIKSREEIQRTLDNWNELKGCGFMDEMWQYCGTEQKVLKCVERFLDESDYRVKQVRGIYLLDGMVCHGTVDFGPCDRSCFFFWREEWLDKLNESR